MMTKALTLACCLAVAGPVAAMDPVASGEAPEPWRVVIQVSESDPDLWRRALANARNMKILAGNEGVEVAMVAYSGGVEMLYPDSPVNERLREVMGRDVEVLACAISLKGRDVGTADLAPGVESVRSGALELVRRQREGWAYLRP